MATSLINVEQSDLALRLADAELRAANAEQRIIDMEKQHKASIQNVAEWLYQQIGMTGQDAPGFLAGVRCEQERIRQRAAEQQEREQLELSTELESKALLGWLCRMIYRPKS